MTIGDRIRKARKARGLTQKQLGEASGTSEITIRQYETGKRQPRIKQLRAVASALGVNITDLVPEDMVGSVVAADLIDCINSTKGPWVRIFPPLTPQERIEKALSSLNDAGQQKAVERVEELTEIPKYQRQPEEGEESAVDPQEND